MNPLEKLKRVTADIELCLQSTATWPTHAGEYIGELIAHGETLVEHLQVTDNTGGEYYWRELAAFKGAAAAALSRLGRPK